MFRKEVLLAALDVLAAYACTSLALHLRFPGGIPPVHALPFLTLLPLFIIVRLAAAHYFGLYDFRHKLTLPDHLFASIGGAATGVASGYMLSALLLLYYEPAWQLSRLAAMTDCCLLLAWFTLSRWATLQWLRVEGHRVRLLLVGPVEVCRELMDEITQHAPKPVDLLGVCSTEDDADCEKVLGEIGDIDKIMKENAVDQVILASFDLPQADLHSLLKTCDALSAECFLFPNLDLPILASSTVLSIAGLPLIPLCPLFATSLYKPVKRILDILAAAILLIITSPATVVAAAAIKISSPGPVLFTQQRVGLHGRAFRIYKLRTMVAGAEEHSGPVLSSGNDTRVTKAGRFLRRFRVDEIPQLWNVLSGKMSLVGPRPERSQFVEEFIKENPLYERRLLIKPGLTGLAQIHGRYDTDYAHKLRYDLIYMNTVSFAADIRILASTVRTVLTGHGTS